MNRLLVKLLLVFLCSISFIGAIHKLSLTSENVQWILENQNGSIKVSGSVPGGVYSDLQKAAIIPDVLSGYNDVLTRWVAYDNWTYTGIFNVNEEDISFNVTQLVFEGLDTVAFVELNQMAIGTANNMFVEYVFDVKNHLKTGLNELKITFESPVIAAAQRSSKYFTAPACVPDVYNGECHANQLRKMQASFSWDWGPAFPSVGLWKPAQLEFFNSAVIKAVTTHIERTNGHWRILIRAYIKTSQDRRNIIGYLKATMTVESKQTIMIEKYIDTPNNEDGIIKAKLKLTVSERVVSLWWPNGYGDQPLYDLDVYFSTNDNLEVSHKNLQIGFRTLALVEQDAATILGNDTGSNGLTFYFKVNGYPIFMKGSNWIPANILPELGTYKNTVDELLLAAQESHMAMLRVWGGGVYESDYFYSRCDQLGILIWQDFLFACSMYPADHEFVQNVKTEIEQNVIRLQHHPSIAVWAGNNENELALRGNWYETNSEFEKYKSDYIKLYIDTIKPIVEELDPGRRYLPSSPSNGKESDREGHIALNPADPNYGDTHYYNYLADGWNVNIYPKSRFASEYGFQSMPSIRTMRTATTNEEDFSFDSKYSRHRQHSPNGNSNMMQLVTSHFDINVNDTGFFKKFVFYSQISQAMAMKTESEFYRQSQTDWYTMGALYWQLNDVWQAPSWSGIEYGGKWKMLHYYAKNFFAPVLVSPRLSNGDVTVYLINDRLVPVVNATITVHYYNWSSLVPVDSASYPADASPLSAKKQDILINIWNNKNFGELFLRFSLQAEGIKSSPYNYVLPPLKNINLKKPNIKIKVSKDKFTGRTDDYFRYFVDVEVDTVVLFLWLEADEAGGRFEDNGFIVTQPKLRVNFKAKNNISAKELQDAITYQYYMNSK